MLVDIHQRLITAKYVFERAVSSFIDGSEMSASIALLMTHDAIELLMLAVLDHVGAPSNKKREFMAFWSDMKQAGQAEPPDFYAMESLNKLRVGLKHSGNVPNPNTVRDLLPRARGLFENVLSAYCGLQYKDISLADRITNVEVRELIKGARDKFDAGLKTEAVTDLKIALYKIEHPPNKYIPRIEAPEAPSLPSLPYEWHDIGSGIEKYLKQLHDFLALSAERTNALTFDFDPIRYATFVSSGPRVMMMMDGSFHTGWRRTDDSMTVGEFEELREFLIDYALKASEAYRTVVHHRFR